MCVIGVNKSECDVSICVIKINVVCCVGRVEIQIEI